MFFFTNVPLIYEQSLRLQEADTYLTYKNNVEAHQLLENIIGSNPSKGIEFLALEMKARMLVRHGGGKFDEEVRLIGKYMMEEYPKEYNGFHWKGLTEFRIAMRNYSIKRDNLPLNISKLHIALDNFNKSIDRFETQIKDRINKVEVLIVLGRYNEAITAINNAKDSVKLQKDFHVLILDYLRILCLILKEDPYTNKKADLFKRIKNLPPKVAFNYSSLELKSAFSNPLLDQRLKIKLEEIMKEIKHLNDPEVS